MPFYDVRCLSCGLDTDDVLVGVYVVAPCPACGAPTERVWKSRSAGVNGDEIPGGMWQENGFRHPRKFYSKSERERALAENGKEIQCRHRPLPGTDKSPFTTDWSKGSIDAYTLEAARVLMTRNGSAAGNEPAMDDVPIKWQVRDVHPKHGPGPWRDCEAPK